MKMCCRTGTFLSEPFISNRAAQIHQNRTRPAGRQRQRHDAVACHGWEPELAGDNESDDSERQTTKENTRRTRSSPRTRLATWFALRRSRTCSLRWRLGFGLGEIQSSSNRAPRVWFLGFGCKRSPRLRGKSFIEPRLAPNGKEIPEFSRYGSDSSSRLARCGARKMEVLPCGSAVSVREGREKGRALGLVLAGLRVGLGEGRWGGERW